MKSVAILLLVALLAVSASAAKPKEGCKKYTKDNCNPNAQMCCEDGYNCNNGKCEKQGNQGGVTTLPGTAQKPPQGVTTLPGTAPPQGVTTLPGTVPPQGVTTLPGTAPPQGVTTLPGTAQKPPQGVTTVPGSTNTARPLRLL